MCQIQNGKDKALIGVCYRSPNCSKEEEEALCKMINKITDCEAILIGDFNFADINWEKQEASGHEKVFLDVVNDNFLYQHVDQPTKGINILDLVFSTEENMVEELEVGESFGSSDHQIIRFKLIIAKINSASNNTKRHDYFKANYDQIRVACTEIDWGAVIQGKDVDSDWINLKKVLEDLKIKFIPYKEKQTRQKSLVKQNNC